LRVAETLGVALVDRLSVPAVTVAVAVTFEPDAADAKTNAAVVAAVAAASAVFSVFTRSLLKRVTSFGIAAREDSALPQ
jgi:hypothetical protein